MLKLADLRPFASLFFCTKILSEDPYLKFFISRVRTKHRERFSFFRASVICLPVATYFLSSLPCDEGTIAVNIFEDLPLGGLKLKIMGSPVDFNIFEDLPDLILIII